MISATQRFPKGDGHLSDKKVSNEPHKSYDANSSQCLLDDDSKSVFLERLCSFVRRVLVSLVWLVLFVHSTMLK